MDTANPQNLGFGRNLSRDFTKYKTRSDGSWRNEHERCDIARWNEESYANASEGAEKPYASVPQPGAGDACDHDRQPSEKRHYQDRDQGEWKDSENDVDLPKNEECARKASEQTPAAGAEGDRCWCSCPTGHDADCYLSGHRTGKRHFEDKTHSSIFDDPSKVE